MFLLEFVLFLQIQLCSSRIFIAKSCPTMLSNKLKLASPNQLLCNENLISLLSIKKKTSGNNLPMNPDIFQYPNNRYRKEIINKAFFKYFFSKKTNFEFMRWKQFSCLLKVWKFPNIDISLVMNLYVVTPRQQLNVLYSLT